jgi:hypothetical protein
MQVILFGTCLFLRKLPVYNASKKGTRIKNRVILPRKITVGLLLMSF